MMASSTGVNGRNPFFVDDTDDQHWGNSARQRNRFDDDNDTLEQLVVKKEASERRQVESLDRCVATIYETQRIGGDTSEELLRQREQLNKVERDLDSISAMTKVTQRQLNGMKSIFGGIKNWFQSKNESPSPAREEQHSGLKDSLQTYKDISPPPFHPHPASRLYDDDAAAGVSHTGSKQDGIDERLGILSEGMSVLKNMGLNMNEELSQQNEQITRITGRVDNCEGAVKDQTKQIRTLLR